MGSRPCVRLAAQSPADGPVARARSGPAAQRTGPAAAQRRSGSPSPPAAGPALPRRANREAPAVTRPASNDRTCGCTFCLRCTVQIGRSPGPLVFCYGRYNANRSTETRGITKAARGPPDVAALPGVQSRRCTAAATPVVWHGRCVQNKTETSTKKRPSWGITVDDRGALRFASEPWSAVRRNAVGQQANGPGVGPGCLLPQRRDCRRCTCICRPVARPNEGARQRPLLCAQHPDFVGRVRRNVPLFRWGTNHAPPAVSLPEGGTSTLDHSSNRPAGGWRPAGRARCPENGRGGTHPVPPESATRP